MTAYHISWTIDLDADSPRKAAELALAIQRKAGSLATVFEVTAEDGTIFFVDLDGDEVLR